MNKIPYDDIMKNGIPKKWGDSVAMQNEYSWEEKGWLIPVEHKPSSIAGVGVYVKENVKKGTVLRKGVPGQNMVMAKSLKELPKITQATKEYSTNQVNRWKNSVSTMNEIFDLY